MIIEKVYIENYKCLKKIELKLNEDLNLIVGNNEVGKSTLLEAINLALTCQFNGNNIIYELSPYLFNMEVSSDFINKLKTNQNPTPPEILIELYFKESEEFASLKGNNNSKREDATGIFLKISFNDEYADEYEKYIEKPDTIKTIPIEYYEVKWYSFAHNTITKRSLPIYVSLIDTTTIRLQSGSDIYLRNIINDALDVKERVNLALTYRGLKESFAREESIDTINKKLTSDKGTLSDKKLSVSIDITQKSNWETNLTSYLDEIPFQFIGKGEQNMLKMNLALETKANQSQLILIEEPENHLSFSSMNLLINKIQDKCKDKQLIVATHSAFVLNKLGIKKVILLGHDLSHITLQNLDDETQKYFKKLPGYDTLRLILAKKSILVEGPSDELIVQKAYLNKYNKLPIADGIDVISVRGLSFKRFLEIALLLKKEVHVVTDNDGNIEQLERKYENYTSDKVKIFYDKDTAYPTLEPQIIKINSLKTLNSILGRSDASKNEIQKFMEANKSEAALMIFESATNITFPKYIEDAIE